MAKYDFLCVNGFLSTEMDARAIRSAMDLGVLDVLSAEGATSLSKLSAGRHVNHVGLKLLVDQLEVNCVVARTDDLI